MIQELLYTSFEGDGLRKGTGGGFCTVLATEGMSLATITAIEKLSGYKHPFDINDKRSQFNPVNYRHAIMRIAGTPYSILSRIADAPGEHTGRSNKLAHHVAISEKQLPTCGPAALCLHDQVFRATWDGIVRNEPSRTIPSIPTPVLNQPCTAWEKVSGDAGWAGVVAEHLTSDSDRPIHVIFPLGCNTLPLLREVFLLIPPDLRWKQTFSTYFTTLAAGATCSLRFVLDQTPEAEKARLDRREKLVDLVSKLGSPPAGPLVNAARTGRIEFKQKASVANPRASTKEMAGQKTQSQTIDDEDGEITFDTDPPDFKLAPAAAPRSRVAHTPTKHDIKEEKPRRLLVPILVASIAIAVLFLLVGIGSLVYMLSNREQIASEENGEANLPTTVDTQSAEQPSSDAPSPEDDGQSGASEGDQKPDKTVQGDQTKPGEANKSSEATGVDTGNANGRSVSESEKDQSERQGRRPIEQAAPPANDLSQTNQSKEQSSETANKEFPFFEIPLSLNDKETVTYALAGKVTNLELFGLEAFEGNDFVPAKRLAYDLDQQRLVVRHAPPERAEVAEFSIEEGKLMFKWLQDGVNKLKSGAAQQQLKGLRWCLLGVVYENGDRELLRLGKPVIKNSLTLYKNSFLDLASDELLNTGLPKSENWIVSTPWKVKIEIDIPSFLLGNDDESKTQDKCTLDRIYSDVNQQQNAENDRLRLRYILANSKLSLGIDYLKFKNDIKLEQEWFIEKKWGPLINKDLDLVVNKFKAIRDELLKQPATPPSPTPIPTTPGLAGHAGATRNSPDVQETIKKIDEVLAWLAYLKKFADQPDQKLIEGAISVRYSERDAAMMAPYLIAYGAKKDLSFEILKITN